MVTIEGQYFRSTETFNRNLFYLSDQDCTSYAKMTIIKG